MSEAVIETRRVRIKQGLDLHLGVAPDSTINFPKPSGTTAILGRDFPGTRFDVLADKGELVKAGEPVMRDRSLPDVLFTSPVSGIVSAVNRGARRALMSLVVTSDGRGSSIQFDIPEAPTGVDIRRLMLQSGIWTALKSRPFGCTPDPAGKPKALLVTAIDTYPLAPQPGVIITHYFDQFCVGLEAISSIVESPVYLCKSPGSEFHPDRFDGGTVVEFDGPHPAGLPGTHINALSPIGFDDTEVWYIGYQDIISLGHLVDTGRPWFERVVSLAGPGVRKPRLLTIPIGAGLDDICADELREGNYRIISGSPLSGHTAAGDQAYLGMGHCQVTVIPEATGLQTTGLSPSRGTVSGGAVDPLIPIADLDRVSPPGVLAVPLLRALLVGDIERARDLGALELVEEDLALLSFVCPSKTDYGPLLRDILNQLHKEALSKRT